MIWGLAVLAGAYAVAVARLSRRDADWPAGRSLAWYAGLATAAAATFGHHHDFRAHMSAHLLLGMAAPLLLVLGRPVTLTLRALPVGPARRVSRVLRTPALRMVTHPVTAAVLDAGGLWLLYTTDLYAQALARPWLHTLVQAHMLLAGGLLTAAVIGRDPAPHRPGPIVRGAVFLAFVAAHGILAKHLYGYPPPGVPAGEAAAGAQIMYYGGDLLHLVVIVLFFRQCFAPTRQRRPWRLVSVAPAGESRGDAA
ncbi:cytochrome c oxidase assembly protein [Actinoplanes sp. M2I2]|uniref:cytochrome c oxidase assembly protein n=1 Tax=Actinoplanes sp. M2I2 TaxID=1734444 RepID=UPI0020204D39|nr:cytochrome c oxidase assembly protein [Actinoplanes sp. M2I2]